MDTSTLRARHLLNQQLTDLGWFAIQQTKELLLAFDSGQGEGVPILAHGVFQRLEKMNLQDLSITDENENLSETTLQNLSRCVAVATHAYASAKYQIGRLAPMDENPTFILAAIDRTESRYSGLLLDTRRAARNSRVARLREILLACLDAVKIDVGYIMQTLGGRQDTIKSNKLIAVRAATIARRYAMLSAACLQLMFRLTNTRKAAGLRQVAERRTQLMRSASEILAAIPTAQGMAPGNIMRLSARCDSIGWIDVEDGYTAISVAAGQVTELRLPRRNAMRAGIAQGSWLYVQGVIGEDNGVTFLEIGLLPTTNNAVDIWEDYLVTQVRPVYDLYPRSIDMGWEFPDLREIGARNDLHGRL